MYTFLEDKPDIILGVGFHVPQKVKIIDTAHEVVFELVELFVDFLFEFFEGKVEVDVVEAVGMVDLVAVDELGEVGLFFLHWGKISVVNYKSG